MTVKASLWDRTVDTLYNDLYPQFRKPIIKSKILLLEKQYWDASDKTWDVDTANSVDFLKLCIDILIDFGSAGITARQLKEYESSVDTLFGNFELDVDYINTFTSSEGTWLLTPDNVRLYKRTYTALTDRRIPCSDYYKMDIEYIEVLYEKFIDGLSRYCTVQERTLESCDSVEQRPLDLVESQRHSVGLIRIVLAMITLCKGALYEITPE